RWSLWLATAVTSGSAAVLFRGSAVDVAIAAVTGVAIFGLGALLGKHPQARFLLDFVGALVASLLAAAGASVVGGSREVVLLAGMIALFPGMTFTTALAELAQKNLVAGAARLMEAAVTFIALVFGIALSIALTSWLDVGMAAPPAKAPLAWPIQALAAVGTSLSLGVVFGVPRRLLWTALISGAAGYATTALAGPYLPSYVAAFVAATIVCAIANLLARKTHRPAQLYQLPGMMLLVPGSLGFLSLGDLLKGTYEAGVEKGLLTLLIAGGLVMGVLLANVLFPPNKLL
ncbi:MAG: threonine/serine exporter family protein, partial [Myxococcales bacterium]|nr:threonine/serine exporter family protein [Myxococcales bacterium]